MSSFSSPVSPLPKGREAPTSPAIQDLIASFGEAGGQRGVAALSLRGPVVHVEVNADRPQPGASVMKILVAAAVYEEAEAGRLDLAESVVRGDLHSTVYPSILAAFAADDRLTLRQLCALMLITSDNPAADVLIDRVGLDRVNITAREFGAHATTLVVGFRDDQLGSTGRRNVTTAADTITILRALASHDRYRPVLDAMRHNLRNTRIPARLPDTVPVAHKTGSLTGVVNDAGIIYGRHVDLAVAFLTDEESDPARTSIEIAETTSALWAALGEPID